MLQDQVSQLQQSLEINKQIQSTILESANNPKTVSGHRNSVVHIPSAEKDNVEQNQISVLDELKNVLIQKN